MILGLDPSSEHNSPIRSAAKNGHTKIVKLLMKDSRVDPSEQNNSAIRHAVDKDYTSIVKLLLRDERVNPSVDDQLPIICASMNGNVEIAELLLSDLRTDPSCRDNLPIRKALEKRACRDGRSTSISRSRSLRWKQLPNQESIYEWTLRDG